MTVPLSDPALEERRQELLAQINQLGDLRPGSLVERYNKCGRANCQCAQPGARGHGPQWVVTTRVGGKTRTRAIPPEALEETRAQIAECQRLRQLVAELIDVSEQICQGRIQAARSEAADEGKKKPARRSSTPPLVPNSTSCSART